MPIQIAVAGCWLAAIPLVAYMEGGEQEVEKAKQEFICTEVGPFVLLAIAGASLLWHVVT